MDDKFLLIVFSRIMFHKGIINNFNFEIHDIHDTVVDSTSETLHPFIAGFRAILTQKMLSWHQYITNNVQVSINIIVLFERIEEINRNSASVM